MASLILNANTEKSNYLRNAMRADGVSALLGGILFILDGGLVAQFLNVGDTAFYMAFGVVLLFHGATLFYFSRTPDVPRRYVQYTILVDVLWMIASIFLIISSSFGIPDAGKWAIFIVNEAVLAFAYFKYMGLRRLS